MIHWSNGYVMMKKCCRVIMFYSTPSLAQDCLSVIKIHHILHLHQIKMILEPRFQPPDYIQIKCSKLWWSMGMDWKNCCEHSAMPHWFVFIISFLLMFCYRKYTVREKYNQALGNLIYFTRSCDDFFDESFTFLRDELPLSAWRLQVHYGQWLLFYGGLLSDGK